MTRVSAIKKVKLRTYIGLGLALILLPLVLFSTFRPLATKATWMNDSWGYRTPLSFTHNAVVTNTKVKFDIDTATLISAGKMQSDCGDSRFTNVNGDVLSYYIDGSGDGCNNAGTDYYVLIPTINNGSTFIYHYYGNPAASDGTVTSQFAQSTTSPSGGSITSGTEEKSTGPVLSWSLDDGQGTTTQDSSANNLDGTVTAAVWKTEDMCVSGKCLFFDGTNDEVTISDDDKLDVTDSSDFTISLWVRLNALTSDRTLVSKKSTTAAASAGYMLYYNSSSGTIDFAVSDGTDQFVVTSTTFTRTNEWVHITAVYTDSSASTSTIYIDGADLKASTSGTIGNVNSMANAISFRIATAGDGSADMQGFLDEVKLYTYAQSAAQVKSTMASKGANELASTSFGQTNNKTFSSGLTGYWKMDETSWATDCSTTSVTDSSGNGNNGKPCPNASAATVAAGKFGNGGSFDGTNDYVDVPDATTLNPGTADFTVSFWTNPSAVTSGASFLGKGFVGSGPGYGFRISGTSPSFWAADGSNVTEITHSQVLSTSTWYHIVGVRKNNVMSIYVNGVLGSTTGDAAYNITSNGGSPTLNFGARSSGAAGFSAGSLDEIRMYNKALSDQEIKQLYVWAPGPVGYWKMDEGQGTSVADSSGNGYTATITDSSSTELGGWMSGKLGKTYDMRGAETSDLIDISTTISMGTRNTISFWGNFDDLASQDVVIGGNSTANGDGYMVYLDGTNIYSRQALTTGVSVATSLSANTWYHIEVVRDGTSVTFYKNGVIVGTTQTYGSNNSFTLKSLVNYDNGTTDFALSGKVDDLRIYDYPRTPSQVLEDMNGGHPVGGSPFASEVSYWSMDEGQGTTAHDSNSINGNDLTLSAASWTTTAKTNTAWNGLGTNWLSRADDDDFDFTATDDFAISMWFKSDNASNPAATEYLLDKSLSGGVQAAGYAIYAKTSGLVCFGIDDDTTWSPDDEACSTSDIYDATWHHIVVQKTGTTKIEIFVDTKLASTDSTIAATGTLANSKIFYIGDRDGTDNADEFNGDIDTVKVYRSTLTSDLVFVDYNGGASINLGTTASTEASQTTDGQGVDPIDYWNFDEKTGVTAADRGTGAKNGTLSGNTLWSAGKYGSAAHFDGTSGVVSVGGFTPPAIMTYETWFNAQGLGENSLGRIAVHSNFDIFLLASSLQFQANWSTAGKWTVSIPTFGTWHHLVVVYNSGSVANDPTIYIDGVSQTVTETQTPVGSITLSSATLRIGNTSGDDRTFDGSIDEMKIFDYARTQGQVAYDYNRGGPIGWWKFDDCQGTTAYDSSGNGNNATLTYSLLPYTQVGTCTSGTASDAWYGGASGRFNGSIAIDVNSDSISMGNLSLFSFERTTPFSVSVWIKTSTDAAMNLVGKQDSADPYTGWSLQTGGLGFVYFQMINTFATNHLEVKTPFTYSDNVWHHIVATYSGNSSPSGIHIYVDGKDKTLETEYDLLSASIVNSIPLTVGSRNLVGQEYSGLVDDVRIYNYVLSSSQVKNIMNGGSGINFGPTSGQP
jgi:hypothetical protein